MKKGIVLGVAVLLLVVTGCAKKQIYTSSPPPKTFGNDLFEVKLEPLKAERYDYYNRFRFVFTNKTDRQLIIDWKDTYYLQNKRNYGRFGWEGLTFEQLNDLQEQPDITVAAGKTVTTDVFPLKLIGWQRGEKSVRLKSTGPEAGFTPGVLTPGENGMSLAVMDNGKLLREQIIVNITLE